MSRFDEEPDGDIHGECAARIHELEALIRDVAIPALTQVNRAICREQVTLITEAPITKLREAIK